MKYSQKQIDAIVDARLAAAHARIQGLEYTIATRDREARQYRLDLEDAQIRFDAIALFAKEAHCPTRQDD